MPSLSPWHVHASQVVLDRAPWLQVVQQDVQLPNGTRIPEYLLATGREYSMVVALTDDEQVLLVKQYKHGLGRVVWDFPAGYLDTPDEDPLACAQRELREETGYTAQTWVALGHWALDSNRGRTGAHLFFARGLTRTTTPHLDDTEALEHFTVPARDIAALLPTEMPTLVCAAIWALAAPFVFKVNGER